MYQKLTINYVEQKGFKLFMVPMSYLMAIPAMMFAEGFMALFGLFMFLIGTVYLYGLIYTIFVDKRIDIKINKDEFIWEIYENDILVEQACVYNKDIKHIKPYVQYVEGSYNFCRITFTLKDERKIVLEDGLTFSFAQEHTDILYLLDFYKYKNENFSDFETSLNNSTYSNNKENLRMQIFVSGLEKLFGSFFRTLKRKRKFFLVFAILFVVNIVVNIASLKLGLFDTEYSLKKTSPSVMNLSFPKGTKKVFVSDGYYYSLYKSEKEYFFLKQKEFDLEARVPVVNMEVDLKKLYYEIRDLENAQEVLTNIKNNGFRKVETWEYLFKSFWLINNQPTTLEQKRRDYLLSNYKKYQEKIDLEKNFATAKQSMKIENKKAFRKLSTDEKKRIKKQFAKIYRDLVTFNPITKNLFDKDLKYKRISDKYELIYLSSFEKDNNKKIPNLYLIKKSGEYINIFPSWAKKKIETASLEFKKLKKRPSYDF